MATRKFNDRQSTRKLMSIRRLAGRYWQAEPLLEFAARGWVADLDAVLSVIREMLDNGRPEEVADLAVYLASDEAGFMTGSAVVLDGGWTAL